jgi:transposase
MATWRWEKVANTQEGLFVSFKDLPRSTGHPFYEAFDVQLRSRGFDRYVEGLCAKFYASTMGRPGLAPGVYFRALLVGYFEGIGSERGIAWRLADSLSLRFFPRAGSNPAGVAVPE